MITLEKDGDYVWEMVDDSVLDQSIPETAVPMFLRSAPEAEATRLRKEFQLLHVYESPLHGDIRCSNPIGHAGPCSWEQKSADYGLRLLKASQREEEWFWENRGAQMRRWREDQVWTQSKMADELETTDWILVRAEGGKFYNPELYDRFLRLVGRFVVEGRGR